MSASEDFYGLGFDFGTSGARINVVSSQDLEVLYEDAVPYSEQSPEVWSDAMDKLLRNIPLDFRRQIQRVCVSGTSSSVMLADRDFGAVTRGPRMYDFSASKESVEIVSSFAPLGHTVRSSTSTLAKILMWHLEDPVLANERICHQADFLASKLTGVETGFCTDWNNVLKLGYDVKELRYPGWMLDLLKTQGLSEELLPRVVSPGREMAKISAEASKRYELPENCIVVGGTTDSIAAFIAARASEPGQAVTSLGSTVAIKMLSTVQVDDADYGVYSHRLGDSWLVGGASNVGCSVLRQEKFSNEELVDLSNSIDPATDPPPHIKYYPLTKQGERFPINDPKKLPVLEPKPQSRGDYLHGLLHGIAQVEVDGFAKLKDLGASPVTKVYTAGGGSMNDMWMKMRERMLGVPVSAAENTDAAFGVALLALNKI